MNQTSQLIDALRERTQLDVDSPTALYKRLQTAIRKTIESGLIDTDEALPSERDLSSGLNVSRVTVRAAIRGLVDEGILVQRRGAGTFVAKRVEQRLSRLTGFTGDVTARGMAPGVEWLDRGTGIATPEEALALNLSPGQDVARLYRIRTADGKPMCLEQATLPLDILPKPEEVERSLYEILDQSGMRPVRGLQRLRAELLTMENARLLDVQPGTACLYIERRSYLENGRPIEFVRSYYRGDAYDFIVELTL